MHFAVCTICPSDSALVIRPLSAPPLKAGIYKHGFIWPAKNLPPPNIGAGALDFYFDPLTAWINVVPVMSSGLLLLGENTLPLLDRFQDSSWEMRWLGYMYVPVSSPWDGSLQSRSFRISNAGLL